MTGSGERYISWPMGDPFTPEKFPEPKGPPLMGVFNKECVPETWAAKSASGFPRRNPLSAVRLEMKGDMSGEKAVPYTEENGEYGDMMTCRNGDATCTACR